MTDRIAVSGVNFVGQPRICDPPPSHADALALRARDARERAHRLAAAVRRCVRRGRRTPSPRSKASDAAAWILALGRAHSRRCHRVASSGAGCDAGCGRCGRSCRGGCAIGRSARSPRAACQSGEGRGEGDVLGGEPVVRGEVRGGDGARRRLPDGRVAASGAMRRPRRAPRERWMRRAQGRGVRVSVSICTRGGPNCVAGGGDTSPLATERSVAIWWTTTAGVSSGRDDD